MPSPSNRRVLATLARFTAVVLVMLMPVAAAVAPSPASVTVTASPSTVVPGNKVNLVAGMPVSDAGTISQQIVMQIDPTKAKLTSASDVVAPAGWTVSYCSTTCTSPPTNFTATPPANAAAWAAVKAVRAVGDVNSQGAYQGKQLAARTATMAIPASGPFASSGSGDGWSVFFDDRGYLFNVFHHQSANNSQVDCRDRNGVSCGANWPFGRGTGVGYTSYVSNGWYDPVYKRIWFDATRNYDVVFECIDVADIKTPKPCGGSVGTTFVRTGVSKSPIAGTPNFGSFSTWKTRGIAQAGGRVFSQTNGTAAGGPVVTCVDTQANGGLGARCPGSPLAPIPGQSSDYIGAVATIAGKLFVTGSNTAPRGGLMCFEPSTLQACSGSWPQTWSMALAGRQYNVFEIPTATGELGGVCVTSAKCFSLTGSPVTLNSGLASWYDGVGDAWGYAEHALRQGSRLYRGNGNGAAAGAGSKIFSCWDQSLNSGSGGVCANWPIAVTNYAIALDPLNDNCVWKNDHENAIRAYDATTATSGCVTPPSKVVIPAAVTVPRMACASPGSGVREWRSIKLLAPSASGYASAKLTVLDSSGNEIPGWIDIAFDPASSRLIDLSNLTVATTGQKPIFIVKYTGLTSATNTSVEVAAVGDSPELCLTPEAVSTCPISPAPGQIPDSPTNGSFAVLGDGSATTGSSTTNFGQGTGTVTVAAGPSPSCSSSLSGQALSNDESALPVAGVTVTLLDSSSNTLMTTTTDSSGNYSFPLLSPGSYKVKFSGTATQTVKNSRLIASSSGPGAATSFTTGSGTGAASTATSPSTDIAVAGPGVVNGLYNLSAQGVADTSSGPSGQAQTASLTANDLAGTGSTMTASSVYLCPAGAAAPYNASTCTLRPTVGSPLTVANVGTYSLNPTTGVVTFTPAVGYSGTPAPLNYIAKDSANNVVTSTYTPTVVPPPTVTANTSTGNWDANQTISVLGNDTAGTGATLKPATVKLCPLSATTPYTASNCNQDSINVSGEGTYTANSDGTVTFDPLPSFSGTVSTPVRYLVQDSLSQVGSALITPTVTAPSAPVATPGSQAVLPGATATFASVLTGPGALATGSGLKSGASGGPCLVDPADSQCKTTFSIAGEGTWSIDQTTGVATFAADQNASGPQTPVTYRVTDAIGQTATSTLTPVIPLPPSATADTPAAGAWDTNQAINILGNDAASPPATFDTGSVTICAAGTATNACTGTTLNVSGEGTYTVNNNGTVTFDPLPSFTGQATAIKYVVADSTGQKATATLQPSVTSPAAPQASAEQKQVFPGGSATFTSVLTGPGALATGSGLKTGPSGGPCIVSGGSCVASLTITGEGTWTIDQTTGVATFAADPAATPGTKTPVTYRVTDAVGQTATSTLTPVIPPPPTATPDTSSGNWNTNQVIDVVGNDSASPPATLDTGSVTICATGTATNACTGTTLNVSGEGTYTVNNDGTVTFDPLPSFTGQATAIKYVVADSSGQVAASTIRPTVVMPPAPQASPEQQAVLPGNTVSFTSVLSALATGSGLQDDQTNGPCFVSGGSCVTTLAVTGEGTWTIDQSTGVAQFAADPAATSGTKTSVTYRVTDVLGRTATSTLTPVIPLAPTAAPDTSVGVVGAQQVSRVVTNDQATSPATISASTLALCPVPTPSPITAAACNLASLAVSGEGSYTVITSGPDAGSIEFTPEPAFTGYATPRPYVVLDTVGQVATSTYTPQVVSIPPPAAQPDSTMGLPGATQLVNPLLNDTPGSASYPLAGTTVQLCAPNEVAPACTQSSLTTSDGTFTVNPLTGFISYQPVTGMLGTAAAISYSVTDTAGQRTSSTYTPRVVGVGPPQVAPSSVSVAHGTPGTMTPQVTPGTTPIDPSKTCLAAPGATCAPGEVSLTRPEGTYVLDPATGIVTFTPARGFSGTPASPPSLCVTDEVGQGACGLLTPTVAPAPAPPAQGESGQALPGAPVPSALPEIESTMAGQPVSLRPLANDSPSSGAMLDPSTVRLRDPRTGRYQEQVTIPGTGTFRVNPGGTITFTPQAGFIGTTPSITYRVKDSLGRTATSTVTVIVRDTPPPWADPQFGQAMRSQTVIFDPAAANAPGGSPFVPSSVRIKVPATGRWTTTVKVPGESTWTVDPATGLVRFTPLRSFSGAATPIAYRIANARGQRVSSTLNPVIRQKPPALSITTRASHTTLRPGQRSLITLRIANHGLATTTRTVTRAPIPRGFAVANPMGGTVRGGWIWFTTGNLKAGGGTTRRFVLVATSAGVGQGNQQLTGWATSSNTRSANDPTALKVIGAVSRKAPVTG